MTELKYLPADWMDEYVPDAQADPDKFIFREATGVFFLRPFEDQEDEETYQRKLQHGDIVMFQEHRQFGDFLLMIEADGSWETDKPIPEQANCLRLDHDTDTLQQSVEKLISENSLSEGDHDIDAYWWSSYHVPLNFIVEGETAKFVKIEGVA
ncbi:hypothetical protein RMS29_028450 (plasmid) [Agrobacterium rosae]|uniref:DUF4265 domain-containing protein n=1 Tax=Agrobacterium rosae TaxID=1972867 RepID=A0ABU4W501_9HYPH|nr:hypothetical protein [Agrobacterium rosae]MDX8332868.1 hypothetical protein [Agrobacterium rosae]